MRRVLTLLPVLLVLLAFVPERDVCACGGIFVNTIYSETPTITQETMESHPWAVLNCYYSSFNPFCKPTFMFEYPTQCSERDPATGQCIEWRVTYIWSMDSLHALVEPPAFRNHSVPQTHYEK